MSVEFGSPWMLALLPLCLAAAFLLARRARRAPGLALALRSLLIVLCVLAMAAPSVSLPGGPSGVWLLVDASASASALQEEMTGAVRAAAAHQNSRVRAGVIAFGANAMVEAPLSEALRYTGVRTAVDPRDTDLSAALTLAGALLPAETGGRVAVLSDGLTGDASGAADALARRNIPVDVLLFAPQTPSDAQVSEVRVPSSAYAGQSIPVTVRVDAARDMTAALTLYQNRVPAETRQVTLRKGENTFLFRDTAAQTGVVTYEARLSAPEDDCSQNDSLGAYMYVQGAPNVLIVEGRAGEGSEMEAMLAAAGMRCERILPAQLPADAASLQAYDAAVLVNVDYDAADAGQWLALQTAVRSLGRGLAVIGGDSSYALGNYRGSLLEDMLPVTIDVRSKLDLPSLALMLVIDKSGSMTEGMFGTTRLELAKEAAMRACEVLTENDQVGVIAFDDAAKWVVPLRAADDVPAIQRMIGTIRPGGGTAFYTALYESLHALADSDAAQKHVIFLTDGEPGDTGYDLLADQMAQRGMTLTTVAVGSGADQRLLAALARRGGGRAYAADEFDSLPKIFTKETYLVSGSYVQNRTFTPVVTNDSPLTDFAGFPPLDGYLAATEKSLATVELISDREDPLLAWWQYGAGRVLCFTSDSRGAWTRDFLRWPEASAFFGGMAAFVLPTRQNGGEMSAVRTGDSLQITYTAPEDGTGLDTVLTVLAPDGGEASVTLTETARGVYTGAAPAAEYGAYALRADQYDAEGSLVRTMESGAVAGYAPEYDLRRSADDGALTRLAERTGGRVITDPAGLLAAGNAGSMRRAELKGPLLAAQPPLLLLDIAQRRFGLGARLQKRFQKRKAPAAKPAPAASSRPKPKPGRPAAPSDTAQALLDRQKNRKIL